MAEAEADAGEEAGALAEAEVPVKSKIRVLKRGLQGDEEYVRQRKIFYDQFVKSEGYDVDWDKLDYYFSACKFEYGESYDELNNDELMELLIKTAIDEENEESGRNLKFVEYVSANVATVKGFLFYITFLAKDLSSSNPEPKVYQTKVVKFCEEIDVIEFKLKPTQA